MKCIENKIITENYKNIYLLSKINDLAIIILLIYIKKTSGV